MKGNLPKEKIHKLTVEDSSKGGKTVTEKQRLAQKWRWYKQKLKLGKIESPNPKWLIERVENDKSYAIDMLNDIDKLAQREGYPIAKLIILKNLIYRSLHGIKVSGKLQHEHTAKIVTMNVIYPVSKEELEEIKKRLQ